MLMWVLQACWTHTHLKVSVFDCPSHWCTVLKWYQSQEFCEGSVRCICQSSTSKSPICANPSSSISCSSVGW